MRNEKDMYFSTCSRLLNGRVEWLAGSLSGFLSRFDTINGPHNLFARSFVQEEIAIWQAQVV
jgi:hypothetical protein